MTMISKREKVANSGTSLHAANSRLRVAFLSTYINHAIALKYHLLPGEQYVYCDLLTVKKDFTVLLNSAPDTLYKQLLVAFLSLGRPDYDVLKTELSKRSHQLPENSKLLGLFKTCPFSISYYAELYTLKQQQEILEVTPRQLVTNPELQENVYVTNL